jgi:predicted DNA-binding transcriptional regulator AlpA
MMPSRRSRDEDDRGDRFLRMKQVALMLGISRHTLRRLIARDATFPRFVELTPGIRVVRQRDVSLWIRRKELAARARAPVAQGAQDAHN